MGEWGQAPILDKSESFVVISFWLKKNSPAIHIVGLLFHMCGHSLVPFKDVTNIVKLFL